MALVNDNYPRTDSYIAFAQEATFGTAIADDQNFTKLDTADNSVPSFEEADFKDDEMRNNGLNILTGADVYRTTNGVWQRYSIPAFIATEKNLADFVYAACQTMDEGETPNFSKLSILEGTVNPDFSSNAGYFFTLLIKNPIASFSQKLTSCIMESLEITFDYGAHGGRGIISGTALTGKGFIGTSNPSGTNIYDGSDVLTCHLTDSLTINSVNLQWYMVKIRIQNKIDWVGYSSGKADQYAIVGQDVFFDATIKYDNNSKALLNSQNTDVGAILFSLGTSNPYFSFGADGARGSMKVDRGGTDSIQKINLSLRCEDPTGSGFQFTVADGTDRSWPT